jgi:colanic acid biosynthesis glycosyl transferase WcaI
MTVAPKHVVIVTPYFWPELIGSAPYVTDFAEALAAEGHAVSVFTNRPHYPSRSAFPEYATGQRDRENRGAVRIFRMDRGRDSSDFFQRAAGDLRFLLRTFRTRRLLATPASVIVAFVPSCLSILAARRLAPRDAKVVAVVHDIESGLLLGEGSAKRALLRKTVRVVERIAYGRADKIIVLTTAMRQELAAIGVKRQAHVIPIWALIEPQPLNREERPNAPTKIMYSGNFGRKQGLDALVPLVAELNRRRSDLWFVFQGDGSERERIRRALADLGAANTEFRELVPVQMLMQSLREADVHLVLQAPRTANFALPSKLLTIMSAGRPFVASTDPGSAVEELAEEAKAGLVVRTGEISALADAVCRLADDREFRLQCGASGRNYVIDHLSKSRILLSYFRLIFDVPQH